MSNSTTYINLQRKRTFSETMNAIIEFTKREYKGILKAQLYISGPAVLVAAILFSLLFDVFFTLGLTGDPEFFNFETGIYVIGMFISSIIGQIFVTAVSLDYLYIYVNEKPEKITPEMVWKRTKKTFWGLLFHMIILLVLLIIAYVVFIGGFVALITLVSEFLFLLFFVPFGIMFYLMGVFSLYFPIYVFEDRGLDVGTIINRCFKLVRGNWWKTFGVFMITSIIVGVVSSIFFIPPYLMMIFELLQLEGGSEEEILNAINKNWFMTLFFILYALARFILGFLILVGVSFQYFNLVEEKEATGLMDTIASIDEGDSNTRLGLGKSGDSVEGESY